LAGAVESDIPTTVTLRHLHCAPLEKLRRSKDVSPLCVATQGNDCRVFEQEKNVADAPFLAQFDEALLQAQARGVVDRAELEDRDQELFATDLHRSSRMKFYGF
jgi:hypothetical protein